MLQCIIKRKRHSVDRRIGINLIRRSPGKKIPADLRFTTLYRFENGSLQEVTKDA